MENYIERERERNITDILGGPSNNKYGYKAFLKCQVPPRFELGSQDSES